MSDFKSQNPSEREEKILEFWRKNKIFEKSVEKPAGKKPKDSFVFYDGPPFATGLPHYGHILASIIKDVIPRYQAMKGKKVPRRWGWDCHGLPIENEIEKKLGLKTKKDIERIGIEKFNEAAEGAVLEYRDEWKKIIPRIGRWVDMENDYKTMDWTYTESVWWVFKSLFDRGLIYEGYKPMHLCPRCETTLANFEVTQGYKDITDISVVAKFELEDEPNTYLLAWTTTPWTLPGNVALAVGKNIQYTRIKITRGEHKDEIYIAATGKMADIIREGNVFDKGKNLEINHENRDEGFAEISRIFGKELIGKKYKPLFDYYSKDKNLKNCENGWKIYAGDFVTTEEGTGIVHIAPAFGEDDMNLAKKYNLPFIQHVSTDGKFKPEVKDPEADALHRYGASFAGMQVKPKDNPQAADIEIIKWLAANNKLFKKEKIIHAYPHCWRCDTPLLNYAAASWFVKIEEIKNKLIANNKKINWIPEHIKKGRFGKWLEGARDWAISRSRFWGAPLPVWRCEKCGNLKIVGSLEDIRKNVKKSGNQYFAMRHGQAENNVRSVINSKIENNHFGLTDKGKKEAADSAKKLKLKKIDLIFSSDFSRTKQTAEIVAEIIGFDKSKIIFDKRLREVNTGVFDGESSDKYHNFCSIMEKFSKAPVNGENLTELKNRMTEFLYEIEKKYSKKNILIVSHEYPIWLMFAGAAGADVEESIMIRDKKPNFIETAGIKKNEFIPLPHNGNFELDFHRPFIDEIEFDCPSVNSGRACGGGMKRVPEVFDCWFESGSMPFAQAHYPFDPDSVSSLRSDNYGARNKNRLSNLSKKLALSLPKGFPAEFIAEGIDQTRGWFYTLLVLSTGLFNKPAYKNVIVNGIILAESGEKMSKRLKNYPDPMEIISKYGADALRLYLLSSPAVRAEDLNFSERGVDEVYKKTILRLWNVYGFYDLYYADKKATSDKRPRSRTSSLRGTQATSKNILDQWILARLKQLIFGVSKTLDNYELDKAVRPIGEFVDDLSVWYVRRSRERFKTEGEDKRNAVSTTKFVLLEFSKILAPFAPFMAEEIYQSLQNAKKSKAQSVHLENWPALIKTLAGKPKIDKKLIEAMAEVRKICSFGLEARQKAGIKVRQPLASLKIRNPKSEIRNQEEFLNLIKDELNIKEVVFSAEGGSASGGDKNIADEVELDVKITPELKSEGRLREFTRAVQDLRKKFGLKPEQKIVLKIQTDVAGKNFIEKFESEIKKSVGAGKIKFFDENREDAAESENIKIDDFGFKIGISK